MGRLMPPWALFCPDPAGSPARLRGFLRKSFWMPVGRADNVPA